MSNRLAEQLSLQAVGFDAIDDADRRFYFRLGFVPWLDDPNHLILLMSVIRELCPPPSGADAVST